MDNIKNKYKFKEEIFRDRVFIAVIILMFVGGIIAYPYLPDKIITHWNIQGQPDDYMNKFLGTFLFPAVSLAVYLLMLAVPLIDPKRENYARFKKGYRLIRRGLILFFSGLYIISLIYNLGFEVDIGRLVTAGVGILFLIIGNYMPQIRHNYFVGIKVPWTLASEEVWIKTHRLAGKIYVLSGVILILIVFLPAVLRFWILMTVVIGGNAVSVVYSYYLYKKIEKVE